jgi:DNA-binding transcriptional LysR family regulator
VAFETRPVGISTLVVVASRGHALLKRKRLELSHLVDQPWILPRRGVLTRDWIDGIFAQHGLPLPQVRFELDIQGDPLVPMAAASSMLAVTSELPAAQLARAGLAALPIDEFRWRRTVGALTRAGVPVSPLVEHFMEVLASVGAGDMGVR